MYFLTQTAECYGGCSLFFPALNNSGNDIRLMAGVLDSVLLGRSAH